MMGYPSEPHPEPGTAWKEALKDIGSGQRTLYIHIPFCKTRCLFCPFYMGAASETEMTSYVDLLLRELRDASRLPELSGYPINAVYFGGGTPSDLSPHDAERILKLLHASYNLANDCEITMEGRIAGFTDGTVKACLDNGVNRFSIGVQTFNTKLRKMIGRTSDQKEVIDFLNKLAAFNQASVVIDLLYGLPGQTMEDWVEDQRIVLKETAISGLDHYKLNVHPRLPLEQVIEKGKIPPCPDDALCYGMYCEGEEIMNDCGAVRLSIKHYALEYRERNANNDVAGRKNICFPFGVHAGGRAGDFSFRQTDDLKLYREMVEQGVKPLSYAGKLPPDYAVNSTLGGQISRQRGINLPLAAKQDKAMAERICETCEPFLADWQKRGLLSPGRMGWLRLSGYAMFAHKRLVPELMEKVAEAYNKCSSSVSLES
jgi:oxygen-independent coproporphyrinogen-3 oxidase